MTAITIFQSTSRAHMPPNNLENFVLYFRDWSNENWREILENYLT